MNKELNKLLQEFCYAMGCQALYKKENYIECCSNCEYQCSEFNVVKKFISYAENKEKENTNYKQALNKIREIFTECKMLIPHEFDWEEQVNNVLQIIDKVLGGSDE